MENKKCNYNQLISLKLHMCYMVQRYADEGAFYLYSDILHCKSFMFWMLGCADDTVYIQDRIDLYNFMSSIETYLLTV